MTEPDYKALWEQMCERCDELDKQLANVATNDTSQERVDKTSKSVHEEKNHGKAE